MNVVKKVLLFILAILLAIFTWANWPASALANDVRADRIVIEKQARTLSLYRRGAAIKTYRVSLGSRPVGQKERQGDGRTPEGVYVIDQHNPHSSFHRALHVSYPSAADRARAAALGVSPGGDIMIHGLPNHFGWIGRLQRAHDWTAGCIALTDPEIDEIFRAVPDGTRVEIRR
jgi:murein L,D-transpeptidase YafK